MRSLLSTARLANVSARRPWVVVGIWIVAFLAFGAASSNLPNVTNNEQSFINEPEAEHAARLLVERNLRGDIPLDETIIVRHPELTADQPEFQAEVARVIEAVSAVQPHVAYALPAPGPDAPPVVSADGHVQLVFARLNGVVADSAVPAGPFVEAIHELNVGAATNGFEILTSGYASTQEYFAVAAEEDLAAEFQAFPFAILVLIVVFGALVAAFVPLVLAIVAIAVAMGAAALIGELQPLSIFVQNIILTIGLAVGIDYALFIVERFREERARGSENLAAITTAGDTASRAVLFSGVTVIIALGGMFIVPVSIFRTMAIGAVLVVIAAVLASLTLLPAVLSLLGDKVNRLRVPFFGNGTHLHEDQGFWAAGAHFVMRYKYVTALAAAALLVILASSYARIDLGQAGVATLPPGNEARQAFEVLDANFQAGLSTPAEIVIDGDIASPEVQAAIDTLVARIEADAEHGFGALTPVQVAPSGDLALIQVPLSGDVASDEAIEAIRTLREDYVPAAFADTDATALVGGLTAGTFDFFELVKDWTPIVLAFVLGLSFVLLLLVFRSLFVPLKAIVMNLLSVGAAYGLMVLIFQEGHGASLLGFNTVEEIEAWVPLFLFTILFGLSMDYEVFLLSRIRERYDQTRNNAEAVSFGLRSTANIITGAAAIMIIVFSGFALGELVMFQQLGFGLAVAVFFDATIVRMVLVPSTMAMVGDWNWYLPSWLQWLPDLRVEGPAAVHDAVTAPSSAPAAAGD